MKKEFFFLVFFRMIVRYDYHAIRHFITLYAKDDGLLNLPLYLADSISEIHDMSSTL